MNIFLVFALISGSASSECSPITSEQQPVIATEQAAVAAARVAWGRARYSELTIQLRKPYSAQLNNGIWHVVGTPPKNTPYGNLEALLCASDGKVIKVFHVRPSNEVGT